MAREGRRVEYAKRPDQDGARSSAAGLVSGCGMNFLGSPGLQNGARRNTRWSLRAVRRLLGRSSLDDRSEERLSAR